jgi:general stress protein 26
MYASSRKVKQIQRNPKICLAFVEQPNSDRAATISGEAKIILDMEQKRKVWSLAGFDLTQYFPGGPSSADFCFPRIIPSRIEWRDSWAGQSKIYERKAEQSLRTERD